MSRRKITAKAKAAAVLEKLRPEEAAAVLNQLLGKHPELKSEAEELEAIEDRVEEMKRSLELGLLAPAQALCDGIVQGLYRARDTKSDGALGWAVDFPIEEAGFLVEEFLKGCRSSSRKAAHANLMRVLTERAPEWVEALGRAAERAIKE